MKTVKYEVTATDMLGIQQRVVRALIAELTMLAELPEGNFIHTRELAKDTFIPVSLTTRTDTKGEKILLSTLDNVLRQAAAEYIMRHDLASITKEPDDYVNFEYLEGDMFCPVTNSNIDPVQLKKEKAAYRRKVKKEGVWVMKLELHELEGNDNPDYIGGFVGDDFYGSGYDTDWYTRIIASACDTAKVSNPSLLEFGNTIDMTMRLIAGSTIGEVYRGVSYQSLQITDLIAKIDESQKLIDRA